MSHPITDILVLVHNNIDVTSLFAEKLLQHTTNYNLIFVDNGSTDSVVDFLQKGKRKGKWDVIRLEENHGVINGRNIAATHVKSDYFLNLDNDQFVKEGWLTKLHDRMNMGYDVVGVEAWCLYPPNSGTFTIEGKVCNRDYFPMKKCKYPHEHFTYVGCGGMLIKKSVYDTIGLFDEIFNPAYFEDPDFCFKCLKNGFKVGWEPRSGILHLAHQTMAHQSTFNKNKQLIQSWRKFQSKWQPFFPAPSTI